ncbi:MAG: substrate-binding domain-containing protein [Planctomycetes bacterium]|nr:substrate-binding domain-containing protein [Planctomycetota bacterium]
MFVEVRDLESKPPSWLKSWDGDGILTRSGSAAIATAVKRMGVPAVELRSTRLGASFPFVGVDNKAVGAMVADHLLERGFRHFGVYALDTESFFVERRDSFLKQLRQHGLSCTEFRQAGSTEKPSQWERQQSRLMQWIEELPKPVGIMACTDQLGCWLLDACSRQGVRVPEELAVVGVENDETFTTMSTPPLSSVRLAGHQIGYEAASLLDRLFGGEQVPQHTLIAPVGIETRQSSDVVAIENPLLSQAIQLIRDRACKGLRVSDILEVVPISRSSLERGCRTVVGRSPNEEINRVRIHHVCDLLRETDLSLEHIAHRSGFNTSQYMLQLFKRTMGVTPGTYRRQYWIGKNLRVERVAIEMYRGTTASVDKGCGLRKGDSISK